MTAIAASYAGYFTVDYGVDVVEAEVAAVVDAALVEAAPVAVLVREERKCWRECISMNHVWAIMRARRRPVLASRARYSAERLEPATASAMGM
jgi:hypothetical protein